jgi:hypothetical protein
LLHLCKDWSTKKRKNDFEKKTKNESFYDLREDWDLIVSSFQTQYGINIKEKTDMVWNDFCVLVGGLLDTTPLGRIVAIRAEKDKEVIKRFSKDQKRIHDEWRKVQLEDITPEQEKKMFEGLSKMFASMCGGGENK